MRKSPSWKPTSSPVAWTAPNEQAKEMKPPVANGDIEHHHPSVDHVMGPDETLQSLLERLSLSSHLNLFQVRNVFRIETFCLPFWSIELISSNSFSNDAHTITFNQFVWNLSSRFIGFVFFV